MGEKSYKKEEKKPAAFKPVTSKIGRSEFEQLCCNCHPNQKVSGILYQLGSLTIVLLCDSSTVLAPSAKLRIL